MTIAGMLVSMLSRCVPFYCRQTLLDMLFSPVVVQRQVPYLVRTVCFVVGGGSSALLGRGFVITTGAVVHTVHTVWRSAVAALLQGR